MLDEEMTESGSDSEPNLFVVAPDSGPPAEVAFIVPAPAYGSVATDDPIATEPDEPPAEAPHFAAIEALGEGLHRKLDALATAFDREIRAEATREKVVDRLHAELQEYKQGLLLGILRPVFVDLIQLHDDMGKMIAAQPEPEGETARLLQLIRGFQQGVEDILYRQGVEPFAEVGDAFDPRRQRALSTVPTDDPALNKQVAARLRPGFQAADKVIRPEMVTVFAHKPAPPPVDPA
jgi:molecular chaperone GrpE